jgi:hypothetical protein
MTDEAITEETKSPARKTPKQRSYFRTSNLNRFFLDDETSYIEHKQLDEGLFQKYQDLTSTIKLDAAGQETTVDMALGKTRKFLVENLVVGWNLVNEDGSPLEYSPVKLLQLPPELVSGVIEDIYSTNPVLRSDPEAQAEGKAI